MGATIFADFLSVSFKIPRLPLCGCKIYSYFLNHCELHTCKWMGECRLNMRIGMAVISCNEKVWIYDLIFGFVCCAFYAGFRFVFVDASWDRSLFFIKLNDLIRYLSGVNTFLDAVTVRQQIIGIIWFFHSVRPPTSRKKRSTPLIVNNAHNEFKKQKRLSGINSKATVETKIVFN